MSLALADVDSAGLTATVEQLGGASASLSCHLVDVADRGRMERFAAEVVKRHGRVTLLMNIAGVAMHGTFEQGAIQCVDRVQHLIPIKYWEFLVRRSSEIDAGDWRAARERRAGLMRALPISALTLFSRGDGFCQPGRIALGPATMGTAMISGTS